MNFELLTVKVEIAVKLILDNMFQEWVCYGLSSNVVSIVVGY